MSQDIPLQTAAALGTILASIIGATTWIHSGMKNLGESISSLKGETRESIANLRAENRESIANLRTETREGIANLRAETRESMAEFRGELRVFGERLAHIERPQRRKKRQQTDSPV